MKSITIHNIESPLLSLIKSKAKDDRLSLNKTIKNLLESAVGIKKCAPKHQDDFAEFFGTWSQSDLQEFNDATRDLSMVDKKDWE